jgi:thiamine-phosphate pyrophosphorylase
MTRPFDCSLYLVTDRPSCAGRDLLDVVRQAVEGGVSLVQLREKDIETREYVRLARALKDLLTRFGVPLIINDRVDVALAACADGVHVGQEDMHPQDVRSLVGPELIVGHTAHTPELARESASLPVDYLGSGPVFGTRTKQDPKPTLGLDGLTRIREAFSRPLVGIGSITPENAARVIRAGADGVAVVSAICAAPSPREAAASLRQAIEAARRHGNG